MDSPDAPAWLGAKLQHQRNISRDSFCPVPHAKPPQTTMRGSDSLAFPTAWILRPRRRRSNDEL